MATRSPVYEDIVLSKDWELNNLLADIAECLDEKNLDQIKFRLSGESGIGDLNKFDTPLKLFTCLKQTGMISNDNTLLLQAILWHIKRADLYLKACDYAKTVGDSLYFYAPNNAQPVNGYKHVQFHVKGRSDEFMRSNLEALRANVSRLLMIPPEFVLVNGIEQSNSIVVTFLIPEQTINQLKESFFECPKSFAHLGVDGIRFDLLEPFNFSGFIWLMEDSSRRKQRRCNSVEKRRAACYLADDQLLPLRASKSDDIRESGDSGSNSDAIRESGDSGLDERISYDFKDESQA